MSISIIAGPLVGAVIGYITNYLAVKMLFRPRQEIRIGNHVLPFTPGVIPKGKARLARAVGAAVGNTLLTKDDLSNQLLSDKTRGIIKKTAMDLLEKDIKTELLAVTGIDDGAYNRKKDKFAFALSNRIYEAVSEIDIKGKVIETAVAEIRLKLDELQRDSMMGSMIAMMLPEDRIMSLIEPIGGKIEDYVAQYGMDYIRPVVEEKTVELETTTGFDLLNALDISRERTERAIDDTYCRLVTNNLPKVFEYVDVAGLIEDKINEMDVKELEELVLSVMKKELNMIVRLGALIGFLIGIINVFI